MNCEYCGTELKPTIAHRFIDSQISTRFESIEALECPRCYAIYDVDGTELESPPDIDDGTEAHR